MAGQTSLLNTITNEEFTDLTRHIFIDEMKRVEPVAEQLYIKENLEAHTGDSRRYDEIDMDMFASAMDEGEDAAKGYAGVGYNKTMNEKRVAKEIEITFKERRYNRNPNVMGKLTNLSHYCPQRKELDLTHRLTFASATSYTDQDGKTVATTTGDGLALCYSAHTLKYSSSTCRNRVANDPVFSTGALELAQKLGVTDILNNFGERIVKDFNTIITGDDPNTRRSVDRVLESSTDIDYANSGVKNLYTGLRHITLPYLATTATGARDSTKERYWFLAALNGGIGGWQAYYGIFEPANLKTPKAGGNGEDVHNDNWTYGARMSYGIATVSWKGIIGSLPTS